MRNFLVILPILILLFSTSCRNDDDEEEPPITVVYNDENPLNKFHELAGFNSTQNIFSANDYYEQGLTFSPNVKGKIKALVVKLPAVNTNLKVTIWDFETKAILKTEFINVASAHTEVTKSISEMALEKDKKYAITMNVKDWYKHFRQDGNTATYPLNAGNIKFWDYRFKFTSMTQFPDTTAMTHNGGDLSFVFQQTE